MSLFVHFNLDDKIPRTKPQEQSAEQFVVTMSIIIWSLDVSDQSASDNLEHWAVSRLRSIHSWRSAGFIRLLCVPQPYLQTCRAVLQPERRHRDVHVRGRALHRQPPPQTPLPSSWALTTRLATTLPGYMPFTPITSERLLPTSYVVSLIAQKTKRIQTIVRAAISFSPFVFSVCFFFRKLQIRLNWIFKL